MSQFLRHLPALPELDAIGAIDILVVAFLVYQCLMVGRGTRAAPILLATEVIVSFTWLRCGQAWRRCIPFCR